MSCDHQRSLVIKGARLKLFLAFEIISISYRQIALSRVMRWRFVSQQSRPATRFSALAADRSWPRSSPPDVADGIVVQLRPEQAPVGGLPFLVIPPKRQVERVWRPGNGWPTPARYGDNWSSNGAAHLGQLDVFACLDGAHLSVFVRVALVKGGTRGPSTATGCGDK
jgi:hypothetical protein